MVGGGLGYGVLKDLLRKAAKKRRFENREAMPVGEIYERFYASAGLEKAKVLKYWAEVADLLRLDPGRLRPSDRFDGELSPVKGAELGDEIEELSEHFASLCERESVGADFAKIKTLDDLIRTFSQKVNSTRQP